VLDQAWIGVDVGTDHHWAAAVDADGRVLLSRKVANDQQAILGVLAEVQALATRLVWTVDLTTAEAALLLAVLWGQGQQVHYLAAGRSARPRSATAGKQRPTPKTPASSPTSPGCAATCPSCVPART
jgi:hypothetical protein